jgi:hypothetical protein
MVGKETSRSSGAGGRLSTAAQRKTRSLSSSARSSGTYAPYGGALQAYRTFHQKKDATHSPTSSVKPSSSLWGRFVKTIGLGTNARTDNVSAATATGDDGCDYIGSDGTTMLPLRDFLYPILGCPEGVYFSRSTSAQFAVSVGDVLTPVTVPSAQSVIVVGTRSGLLWVALITTSTAGGSDHESTIVGEVLPLSQPILGDCADVVFVTKSSKLRQHFTVSDRRPELLVPLQPPSWWGDAVTSFLMFAPDLSLSSAASDARVIGSTCSDDSESAILILSPTVTLVGNTSVLGWAGECSAVDASTCTVVSWSAAVTIPPQ